MALSFVLVGAVLATSGALADNLETDTDLVANGDQRVKQLGTLLPGHHFEDEVLVYARATGQSTGQYSPPLVVTFSPQATGLSATGGQIALAGAANGFVSTVSGHVPSTPGTYSLTVKWNSDSINSNAATMTYNVVVQAVNTAPTVPGVPQLSATLSNTGLLGLSWSASTDAEGDAVTYTLQRVAGDGTTSVLATGLSSPSFAYAAPGEGEGVWKYRVQATDGALSSAFSPLSAAATVDKTTPTLTSDAPAGWQTSPVTVTFACTDALSGVASCPAAQTFGHGESPFAVEATDAAGNVQSLSGTVKVDTGAPTLTPTLSSPPNANGWHAAAVTVSFACADDLSGIASGACPDDQTFGAGTDQAWSASVADVAGNVASASGVVNVDLLAPTVGLDLALPMSGGLRFAWGHVPATLPCFAEDDLSGVDGACSVDPMPTSVGVHTVAVRARDLAGHEGVSHVTYEVEAWSVTGFKNPVSMSGLNKVKSGSTVPLKFEVFAGATEVTSTANLRISVSSLTSCASTGGATDIDATTTGGTSFRYDESEGQFVYNWQTPRRAAGSCYVVTLTTDSGSSITAAFELK